MRTKPPTGLRKFILRDVPYNPYVRELVVREFDGHQWNCIHRMLHHRDSVKEPKRKAIADVKAHNEKLSAGEVVTAPGLRFSVN